jgi:uncharacterized protein YaiE (UPF0345 family)
VPSTINASASSGLISTADTSTILALQTNGTTAVTIDGSQNVGVGTTTPDILNRGYGTVLGVSNAGVNGAAIQINSVTSAYPALELGRGGVRKALFLASSTATEFGNLEATPLVFITNSAERMRLDSSGNLGIGTTSPASRLDVATANSGITLTNTAVSNKQWRLGGSSAGSFLITETGVADRFTIDTSGNVGVGTTSPANNGSGNTVLDVAAGSAKNANIFLHGGNTSGPTAGFQIQSATDATVYLWNYANAFMAFATNNTERMRITSGGQLQFACTNDGPAQNNVAGFTINTSGATEISRAGAAGLKVNRKTDDGELVGFLQDGTQEGNIVVTGTTVSYNGGHLSRYAQTTAPKDESIFKGTVLSNLDEMNIYTKDGQPVANEQLNKVKVSDTEGDANVAGVCVSWSHDEQHNVDEINMAMTGDMIIRIAQGVTVVRGDLLMSAGDGTAKPQGDDIVRSKTVAKVTSNHITCTYADGSYCVPCVLMAC